MAGADAGRAASPWRALQSDRTSASTAPVAPNSQHPAQTADGAVRCNLERGDRQAARGGGLLQRHFSELEHFDCLLLHWRQIVDGLLQAMVLRLQFKVRRSLGKGFMFGSERRFARLPSPLAAEPVEGAAGGGVGRSACREGGGPEV